MTAHELPIKQSRFRLIDFDAIGVDASPRYLIKEIMPAGGLVVIWGTWKAGKSFVALDLGMHIALGRDFRGHKVRGGAVVYAAPEGHHGFGARVEAWRSHKLAESADAPPFFLVASPLKLVQDCPELIRDIRAQLQARKIGAPAAIFIDTLNRSIAGSESDDAVMGDYLSAANALREAFGCSVIIVHHSGLDNSRMRGHSSLPANLDAELSVKKDANGLITVAVEHMRDGLEGTAFACRLQVVTVGEDSDGDPITSCIVIDAEEPAERVAVPGKGMRLPDGTKAYLAGIKRLMADVGERIRPFADSPEVIAVDREAIRPEFYKRWPADGETEKARNDAKRKQFGRSEKDAMSRNLVVICEIEGRTLVWLAAKA